MSPKFKYTNHFITNSMRMSILAFLVPSLNILQLEDGRKFTAEPMKICILNFPKILSMMRVSYVSS